MKLKANSPIRLKNGKDHRSHTTTKRGDIFECDDVSGKEYLRLGVASPLTADDLMDNPEVALAVAEEAEAKARAAEATAAAAEATARVSAVASGASQGNGNGK